MAYTVKQVAAMCVLADGGPGAMTPVFINGTATPDTTELRVGTTYRMRFISIGSNDSFMMTVSGSGGVASGRLISFDGHDVPAPGIPARPMRFPAGPGHTADFTFTPTAPGAYSFVAERIVPATTIVDTTRAPTSVPIRVLAP